MYSSLENYCVDVSAREGVEGGVIGKIRKRNDGNAMFLLSRRFSRRFTSSNDSLFLSNIIPLVSYTDHP